ACEPRLFADLFEERSRRRGFHPLEEGSRFEFPPEVAALRRLQARANLSARLEERPVLFFPGQEEPEDDLPPVAFPLEIEEDLLRPAERGEPPSNLAQPLLQAPCRGGRGWGGGAPRPRRPPVKPAPERRPRRHVP